MGEVHLTLILIVGIKNTKRMLVESSQDEHSNNLYWFAVYRAITSSVPKRVFYILISARNQTEIPSQSVTVVSLLTTIRAAFQKR